MTPHLSQTSATPNAVEEEQAPPEPPIPVVTVQLPAPARKRAKFIWPRGPAPRFGRSQGKKWYEPEEQDEHGDPPLPATTSNTRRSFPVPKYEDRHSESEPTSDSNKLPGHVKDDKSPGGDREHHGIGETEFDRRKRHLEIKTFLSELPDSPIHYSGRFGSRPDPSSGECFGSCPDTSSSGPNPEEPGTGK
jgi:hypothetical protein